MNSADLQDLPDEVREEIERPQKERGNALDGLATHIAKLRDEAVAARKESGIEATWHDCEEAYLGIDDLTRQDFLAAKWAKPMTMEGGLIKKTNPADSTKATVFVMVTARYVDAGTAKVCETALPVDGKPFTLKATPVPEMSAAAEDDTPAEQITGQPMPRPDGQPATVKDLAKHQISKAEKAAEKACARIYDWMVEYKHPAEMRKVIFDGARLGVGVIHGPIPEARKARVLRRSAPAAVSPQTQTAQAVSTVTLEIVEKIKPAARWVDPWNFYPAPGCGEDIHRGGHAFEYDRMLAAELAGLSGPGWIKPAIMEVLKEGPNKVNLEQGNPNEPQHKKQFDVWHFTGKIARAAFEAANGDQAEELPEGIDEVQAVVTLVNDRVVRAIRPVLESDNLPYRVFNWRRRAGHWAGVGVAEQVKNPQKIVNAATRAMLNNAGMSAGSQIVTIAGALSPADGNNKITPDKLWNLDPANAAGIDDVRKAFASFVWPNMTPQLMTVVEYGFKLAEEHSSIPLITQGQSGKTTPDTFGGQQLQDNNANQLLRDVGFGLNDTVTTPLVDDFYEWLLLDPDVPDEEKGDYQVDTSGALAIIEKALQDQFIPQLVAASKDPAYDLHPGRCMEALLRSKRLSPEQFQLTESEKEAKAQQPPPVPPQIEAAKIRAESAEKIAAQQNQLAAQRNQNDIDRDTAYQNSLNERGAATDALALETLRLKVRLAELEYATQERISLQEAKVKLATKTMELQTQRDLAGKDGLGPEVATPPTEPPGRAPDGAAYQA
jgi:hypothetical protein